MFQNNSASKQFMTWMHTFKNTYISHSPHVVYMIL